MPAWQLNAIDQTLIDLALQEDLGMPFCDITTLSLFPKTNPTITQAHIISKHAEPFIVCGLPIIASILSKLQSPQAKIMPHHQEGAKIATGETLVTLEGPANILLMAERTLLNFLQRLCAIATLTKKFVDAVQGTTLKILDTRKTTPGFRHL